MSDQIPPQSSPGPYTQAPSQSPTGSRWVTVRPPSVTPVVTFTLLGITVLVFLIQLLTRSYSSPLGWPAVIGEKDNQFILLGQFWRFITPVLLHGSIYHLFFNIYALFAF